MDQPMSDRQLAESTHAPSLGRRHYPALDGLRCVAISGVVWHHSLPCALPGWLGRGHVGVPLFFALSGRFIVHRRLARITFPIWLYVSVTGVVVFEFLKSYAY